MSNVLSLVLQIFGYKTNIGQIKFCTCISTYRQTDIASRATLLARLKPTPIKMLKDATLIHQKLVVTAEAAE